MEEFFVRNQRETSKLAKILAKEIIKKPLRTKGALIIGLEGELGSGKTTFIKGFAKGLGIKKRLTSPSFVLIKKYKLPKGRIFNDQFGQTTPSLPIFNLYHVDCYRLNRPKDLLALDFKEIISSPKNIVIIEWAEKIKKILPEDTIWIRFDIVSDKERRIVVEPQVLSN